MFKQIYFWSHGTNGQYLFVWVPDSSLPLHKAWASAKIGSNCQRWSWQWSQNSGFWKVNFLHLCTDLKDVPYIRLTLYLLIYKELTIRGIIVWRQTLGPLSLYYFAEQSSSLGQFLFLYSVAQYHWNIYANRFLFILEAFLLHLHEIPKLHPSLICIQCLSEGSETIPASHTWNCWANLAKLTLAVTGMCDVFSCLKLRGIIGEIIFKLPGLESLPKCEITGMSGIANQSCWLLSWERQVPVAALPKSCEER